MLGPLLFLLFHQRPSDNIGSNTRLFADDCIVYRAIRDHADQEALQEDLVRLAEWEDKWGMEFHPQKCSTLSVTGSRLQPLQKHQQHISSILDALQWESLESRRTKIQLTLLFKIINDLVDIRADDYLASSTERTRQAHSKKFRQVSTRTDSYKEFLAIRRAISLNETLVLFC